jgi:putative mRNA 3-end processing factor
MASGLHPSKWLYPTQDGLYCAAGKFHIDPRRAVERAVITHGHSDHARPSNGAVLATPETLAIMQTRYGEHAGGTLQALPLGQPRTIEAVRLTLVPAGHILGSAQVVLEHQGQRVVVSGDYKRHPDPTCAPFELVTCDLFVTEATFALPVFRHEPVEREVQRLLDSLVRNPERPHLLSVYGLGKCQRMIALLRAHGYDAPIYLHGALMACCELYERLGVRLGALLAFADAEPRTLSGRLVLCPPSALTDRWSRRLDDPVTAFASGWMRVRGRARQRGVELPLVISDHADWPELLATIEETGAPEIWATHGRDDALAHQLALTGRKGRALSLIGYEDEDE